MAKARDKQERYEQIRKSLTRLDLRHHSLRSVGQKLPAGAAETATASSRELYEESLQLSKDCSRIIHDLCDRLDKRDLDSCHSALNQVDLAVRRASQAKTPTLCMVNIWRVIEATEHFLADIAEKYDYARISVETDLEALEREDSKAAELARLFEEYEEVMATKAETPKPEGPPFSHGILHWRGSELFYVERIEDGARWVQLDPDYDMDGVIADDEPAELVKARTIEGYPITLSLDLVVDENEVHNYISSQAGSEYFVTGDQIVGQKKARGSRKGRHG